MDYRSSRGLYNGLCIGAAAFAVLGMVLRQSEGIFLTLAVGLVVAAGVVQWKYGRCPHCGGHVSPHNGAAAHCPHCGERF